MRARTAILLAVLATGLLAMPLRPAPAQSALPAPAIYGVVPDSGPSGAPVVVFGHGFDSTPANDVLTFGGVAATVSFAHHHILVAFVPAGLPLGPVSVALVVSGVASNVGSFTVVAPVPPVLTAINPAQGPPRSPVALQGTGLGSFVNSFFGSHNLTGSQVSFGGTNAHLAFFSNKAVYTFVPGTLQPGTVPVGVLVNGQTSNTLPFAVTPVGSGSFGGMPHGGSFPTP